MTHFSAIHVVLGLTLGTAIGLAYFATLRRNVELYVQQGRFAFAIALHVVRFAAVGLAFASLVQLGASVLIAAFTSFLVVRTVMVRRANGRLAS